MCHTGGRGIKTTTKQTTSCYWHMYNRAGITSKAEARVCSSWVIPAGRLHSWAAAEAAWVHVVCTSASRFPGSASRQTWWTCSRRSRDCHSHRQVVAGADHRPCSQCRGSLAVNALQGPATHTHTHSSLQYSSVAPLVHFVSSLSVAQWSMWKTCSN